MMHGQKNIKYQKYLLEVKAAGALCWQLTTFMYRLSRNGGSLNLVQSSGPVKAWKLYFPSCIGIRNEWIFIPTPPPCHQILMHRISVGRRRTREERADVPVSCRGSTGRTVHTACDWAAQHKAVQYLSIYEFRERIEQKFGSHHVTSLNWF